MTPGAIVTFLPVARHRIRSGSVVEVTDKSATILTAAGWYVIPLSNIRTIKEATACDGQGLDVDQQAEAEREMRQEEDGWGDAT